MSIGDRVRSLLETRAMPNRLEDKTGIDRETWRNLRYSKQKVNEDHIEAICKALPEFRMWIETGKCAPDQGQISPVEKLPSKKKK